MKSPSLHVGVFAVWPPAQLSHKTQPRDPLCRSLQPRAQDPEPGWECAPSGGPPTLWPARPHV